MKTVLLFFVIIFYFAQNSFSSIINVPTDYTTIQSALNNCHKGDIILVAPGTYFENLTWPDKGKIKLRSTGGASVTIIDGSMLGSVVTFAFENISAVDTLTEVGGFTLRNGRVTPDTHDHFGGSAIYMSYAAPKIHDCIIRSCKSIGNGSGNCVGGGVIWGTFSDAILRNIQFTDNSVDSVCTVAGGVVVCDGSNMLIENCRILKNTFNSEFFIEGGIFYMTGCNVRLNRLTITNNLLNIYGSDNLNFNGGIINIQGGSNMYLTLTNCLVANNTITQASGTGAGLAFYLFGTVSITNCTIAFNSGSSGYDIAEAISFPTIIANSIFWNPGDEVQELTSVSTSPSVTYSDIRKGYSGLGNISLDPVFVSKKDLHLKLGSPCLGSGSNADAPNVDLDGNIRPLPEGTNVDMGCYELDQQLPENRANEYDYLPADSGQFALSVFPNPTSGKLLLECTQYASGIIRIVVYDLMQKMVLSQTEYAEEGNMKQYQIDLSSLVTGSYLLEVIDNNGITGRKMIAVIK